MRIKLNIDDDVLFAVKELAQREKKSQGKIISELTRRTFATATAKVSDRLAAYGIRPLPQRGGIVSNALINHLRDKCGV